MIKLLVGLVVFVGLTSWSIVFAQQIEVQPGQVAHCITKFTLDQTQQFASCITQTPTSTATATATATPSGHPNYWHPPTDHSHFDAPPQWVKDKIQQWCAEGRITGAPCVVGQPVFGGDETSSPAENATKHNVFKGVSLVNPSIPGLELFLRYHAGSNPLDRSAQFHSFEVYIKDSQGGVSFLQGHCDAGNPETNRVNRLTNTALRPIIFGVDQASWDAGFRAETWYCFHRGITLFYNLEVTTLLTPGENQVAQNQATWNLTGLRGLNNEYQFIWNLNNDPQRGWYCASPLGTIVNCASGGLPQHIAPTLDADKRLEYGEYRIIAPLQSKQFICPQCVAPN